MASSGEGKPTFGEQEQRAAVDEFVARPKWLGDDAIALRPPAPDASNWVFVTGLARSGTTGIADLINAHPHACVMNEAYVLMYADIPFYQRYYVTPHKPPINHNKAHDRRDNNRFGPADIRALMEGVRSMIAPTAAVFGDKATQLHHQRLPFIKAVFPGCRFVHITRDPWDQVKSMLAQPWWRAPREHRAGRRLSDRELAEMGLTAIARMKRHTQYRWLMGEHADVHRVAFEDIAARPQEVLTELLRFLGLPFDPYDWDAIGRTRYARSVGYWRDNPALVEMHDEGWETGI